MWIKVFSVTFALLVLAALAIHFYGRYRWKAETDAMRARMEAAGAERPGKLVNLAIFDHVFSGRPQRRCMLRAPLGGR